MKHIVCLLLLVVNGPALVAAETGLYDLSDPSHPKPLPDKIEGVKLYSQSNDNKRYFLAFHRSLPFSVPCRQIGLLVGERSIRFNSEGGSERGGYSIETTVEDPGVVPKLVERFHPEVQKRYHPGHRMLVEFLSPRSQFAKGEAVVVKLRITNVGNADFAFMQGGRQRRATRDNQFAFSAHLLDGQAHQTLPDIGDPRHNGGMATSVTLEPGASHDLQVDLSRWFTFPRAGTYLIRGSYYMSFVDPGAKQLGCIWEDFACAEFAFEIKE